MKRLFPKNLVTGRQKDGIINPSVRAAGQLPKNNPERRQDSGQNTERNSA
jgi:hypothetical protein